MAESNDIERLVWVDLGLDNERENIELAQQLDDSGLGGFGYKVNQDDAMILGGDYITKIKEIGRPLFVDLKMNNGGTTMARTVSWLGSLGVDYTNAWAHAESNLAKAMKTLEKDPDAPKMLGVTFYTRWDEGYAQEHHNMSLPELIRHWSDVAIDCGVDGLILPGNMLESVADIDTEKVNPGVRKELGQKTESEQKQVSTPFGNIVAGATSIVVGSPIYRGEEDPVTELGYFLSEVNRGQDFLVSS